MVPSAGRTFIASVPPRLMRFPHLPSRTARRLFGLILAAAASVAAGRAQSAALQLAPVVVVANRLPESSANAGTAVDVVSGADLSREQLTTFADALSGVPGAPAFATGQLGAATSLFLRGANSN